MKKKPNDTVLIKYVADTKEAMADLDKLQKKLERIIVLQKKVSKK